jgi:all-trans-retinol 13,14-reductase
MMTDRVRGAADVLIIGSGIGGLSAGIILSKLGYKVIIAEKNRLPGGLMRSYKKKGFDCPVGIHYLGSLAKGQVMHRMFRHLGVMDRIPLERMGKEGIIDRYIFDDFVFDLPEGIHAFEENLRFTCPDDQEIITKITHNIKDIAARLDALEFLYSPYNSMSSSELLESMGSFLTRHGCSPRLRAILAVPPSWIGLSLDECPVLYHHMALVSYLFSAWRLQINGSQMADVFVDRFEELGGQIMTGDEVEQIAVSGGAVEGVGFKSGLNLKAPVIIAAIHPRNVIDMIPTDYLKPSYRRRIQEMEDTPGIFSASFIVKDKSCRDFSYNIFNVQDDEHGHITNGAFYQLKRSRENGVILLSILVPDSVGSWSSWEKTKSSKRGEDYLEAKATKAEHLLNKALNIIGPLKGVELLDTYTPLTLRDWVNSPGGSAYGLRRSTKHLLKMATLSRPNIRGLYFAGQNMLLPGVVGTVFSSFHSVKQIIGHDRFIRNIAL